jgi:hypothetical protein
MNDEQTISEKMEVVESYLDLVIDSVLWSEPDEYGTQFALIH